MTDVAVVGSGPNGLAAAVTMARAGLKVHVFEAAATPGGGLRTAELMEPAISTTSVRPCTPWFWPHPSSAGSSSSRRVPLEVPELSYGLPARRRPRWRWPTVPWTAPLRNSGGTAPPTAGSMEPLVRRVEGVADLTLNQLLRIPGDPVARRRVRPPGRLERGSPLWNARFSQDLAPALLSGVAAHAVAPLPS